jgi:hypothetical protein
MNPTVVTAMPQGLQSCETCGLLSRPAPGRGRKDVARAATRPLSSANPIASSARGHSC